MAARSDDSLKAEYLLIQSQYEAFDQRALGLKGLATPLLGAGLAAGFRDGGCAILGATLIVALSLWLLEGIWKSFQYCLSSRIRALEAWHRGEGSPDLAPFQIYNSWMESWRREYRRPASLMTILCEPFVFLPYAPMIIIALAGCALA